MNSTIAQLLNNLSLKLNSPLNVDGQIPANTSVLVANTTSEANATATNSLTGEENSPIISFAALQTEVGEVTIKCLNGHFCAFKGVGGWQADIDRACRQSCSAVSSNSGYRFFSSNSGYRLSSLPLPLPSFHVIIISKKSENMYQSCLS